jgi:hypothetical protein
MRNKIQSLESRYYKSVLIALFLFLTLRAAAPDVNVAFIYVSEPVNAYDRLIRAVVYVESRGDTLAYNHTENATGAFQIRPIRVLDYNQRTGNDYKIEDCYSFKISKEIFLYYAKKSDPLDYESIARKWNGSGETTFEYWKKVESCL